MTAWEYDGVPGATIRTSGTRGTFDEKTASAFLALFATSAAHAANAQQNLMAACNKDAVGKKGD